MPSQKHYTLTPEDFLSRAERTALLRTCREMCEKDLLYGRRTWPVRYMLCDLALYSGLRVSEIAALDIGDLNLTPDNAYIIVRHGKGDKKRTVYIDKALAEHLTKYIGYRTHSLLETLTPDTPVFVGQGGRRCPTITLQVSFKQAVKAAGLRDSISIHKCRHTYATYLLNDTGNLRYVQQQLGHADISMTTVYANILPEMNGLLANKIQREE